MITTRQDSRMSNSNDEHELANERTHTRTRSQDDSDIEIEQSSSQLTLRSSREDSRRSLSLRHATSRQDENSDRTQREETRNHSIFIANLDESTLFQSLSQIDNLSREQIENRLYYWKSLVDFEILDKFNRKRSRNDFVDTKKTIKRINIKLLDAKQLYITQNWSIYRIFVQTRENDRRVNQRSAKEILSIAETYLISHERDLWDFVVREDFETYNWESFKKFLEKRLENLEWRNENNWSRLLRAHKRREKDDYAWYQRFDQMIREIESEIDSIEFIFLYHLFRLRFDKAMQNKLSERRDIIKKTSRELLILTIRLRLMIDDSRDKIDDKESANRLIFKSTRDKQARAKNYVKKKSNLNSERDFFAKRSEKRMSDAEKKSLKREKKCFVCKQERHMIKDCSQKSQKK